MDEKVQIEAFRLHLIGGKQHMHTGCDFNPMLIFQDQCNCLIKAQANMQAHVEEERKRLERQLKLEMYQFNTLFEPREI